MRDSFEVESVRRHLLFILTGDVAHRLQALRVRWDPVMARRIPPHVSLVYPEEADDEALLLRRAASVAEKTAPFDIFFGDVTTEDSGRGGVWFPVIDPSDTWGRLRTSILAPPFRQLPMRPHATVVHPRTSDRGLEALVDLKGSSLDREARVTEVLFTETRPPDVEILNRFALAAPPPVRMVAGLLRRDGEALLCHRHPDRVSFPDVWDLPGGHIEEGEPVADALVRELAEEIGIIVEPPRGAPWKTFRADGLQLHVFLVDRWEGEPRNLAVDEHDDLRWISVDGLGALRFADDAYLGMLRESLE
jgi:mutator protein MutT